MLMNKDINCSNFIGLLACLRKHYGDEGVQQVINGLVDNEKYLIADKENPSKLITIQEHHLNDSAYWVSNEFSLALFANAKKVFGGSNALITAGEEAAIEHFSRTAIFVSRICSTKFVCKQAAKINARFNKTKEVKLANLTDNSATFELHYRPNIQLQKDICNWNLGVYKGIGKMTGAIDVKCEETKCLTDGDKHCVFNMTWRKKPFFLKNLLRWILKIISKDLVADYEVMVKEREQLIDSLSLSEKKYRSFIENAPVAMYTINTKGEFTYGNKKLLELTGYKKKDWLDKHFQPIIYPEDLELVMNKVQERMAGKGTTDTYEIRIFDSSGKIMWIKINSTLIYETDEQGVKKLVGIQSFVEDVTDRKQAEESLRESERRFRTLVENAADAFFLNTMDGIIVDVNSRACESLGYTREELLSMTLSDIGIEINNDHPNIHSRDNLIPGKPVTIEGIHRRKDGTSFPVEIQFATVSVAGENLLLGLARDISQRRELEEQLRQSHKMESIGTLAGGIAHDFNNILGIILGNTELAIDDLPKWNPARLNLDEIRIATLRAKDVVRQLLSFARKTKLEKKPTNITPIIKESLKLLRSSISTSVEIRQNIPDYVDTILADPTQINQVLINLCTNADHAMPDGGVIAITLKNIELDEMTATKYPELGSGRYVNLIVSDTGLGISQEEIDRIFDPYFTTKEVDRGTGMGLAVVHGIVKGHNGLITVESELGIGTTFNIYFPAVEKEIVVETETDEKLPAGNERVLFIDDEESIVKLVRLRLERLGYKVEGTTSPIDALALLHSQRDQFDLVITDLTMPKMTGDKLVEEILNIRPDIPIILCSGFSKKIDEKAAKALGAADYIEKPFDKREFAFKVRKVLDNNIRHVPKRLT
jgi:PAS domain S-box-containing protein